MASIADLFFTFRGEDKQLVVDAGKAGDKAGKTLGERLGVSSKAGFATLAAGAGGLALVLAKGGHDVANAMADYRSQTGATQEEAEAAQKTMIELYKTNTDGFATLGKVLTVVHNDMGLVGDEAKRAAQLVLDFSHATGVDAVEAAKALDDASDAYNLTIDQQRDLLDKLIVSQQKYGGSAAENLQTIIALGPALTAANLSYDDGIGLINLFAQAGVDAETSVKGLTKALGKVKSPEELKALIADIAHTEDPFQRAQKAADLFGTKAGTQLGAALAGSTGDLREFTPAVGEAAGATERAGDIIENKFTNRLKILFHELTGDAEGLVSSFEPAIATLAYLPRALGTISAALGLLILRNNQATVSEIAHAVATKIQAAAYLLLHPQYLLTAIQLGLLAAAEIAHSVAAGIATAATTALGVAMNFLLGPIGLIVLAVGALFLAWQTNFLGIRDLVGGVIDFLVEHFGFLIGPIQTLMDVLGGVLDFIGNVVTGIHDFLFGAEKAVDDSGKRMGHSFRQLRDDAAANLIPPPEITDVWDRTMGHIGDSVAAAAPRVSTAMGQLMNGAAAQVRGGGGRIVNETARWLSLTVSQIVQMSPAARQAMAQVFLSAAAGIRDKRSAIDSAIEQLKTDMKNRLTPTKEVAHDIGLLFGKTLSKGLHSADGVVKKQAEGTRALIEAQLVETIKAGGAAGKKIQEELQAKLHSKDPAVRSQAQRTKGIIDAALKAQPPKTPGEAIGQDLSADLRNQGPIVGHVAYNLGVIIARSIRAGVLGAGVPSSGGGGKHEAGQGGLGGYAQGTSYVPYDMFAQIHRGEIIVDPDNSDRIRAGLATLGAGGGNTYQTTLVIPDAKGHDPYAVFDRLGRDVRWGRLNLAGEPAG